VLLTHFQNQLLHTELATPREQTLHRQAIDTFDWLVELRRQRIESIIVSVPGVLWSIGLVSALIAIALYGFVVVSLWLHTALLVLMLGSFG